MSDKMIIMELMEFGPTVKGKPATGIDPIAVTKRTDFEAMVNAHIKDMYGEHFDEIAHSVEIEARNPRGRLAVFKARIDRTKDERDTSDKNWEDSGFDLGFAFLRKRRVLLFVFREIKIV